MIIELLVSTLRPLGLDIKDGAYAPDSDNSAPGKYFVIRADTVPFSFADDAPEFEKYLVQIFLFALPTDDTAELVQDVKQALFAAGFAFPATFDASGSDYRCTVFETENLEAIDYGSS